MVVFTIRFLQDMDTSNTLEVCCCRDESIESSCKAVCDQLIISYLIKTKLFFTRPAPIVELTQDWWKLNLRT